MPFRMETVDQEYRVAEEFRLADHAVGSQSTCEIVDDEPRRKSPVSQNSGEDVVSAFASRNAMKAEAYHVGTPRCEDPACETFSAVGLIILLTTNRRTSV